MTVHLRPLDPVCDRPAAAELWADSFGATWPVLPRALDRLRGGYVADSAGALVGLVGVDLAGGIPLIMVRAREQRRGIGRRLMAAALAELSEANVEWIGLGRGGQDYIWPGVPRDLPGAAAFFERVGWTFVEVTHDVVRALPGYVTPAAVRERDVAVRAELLPESRRAEAFPFVDRHFPNWSEHFRDPAEEVLVVRADGSTIVGALLLQGPASSSVLTPMLGADMGTIGCVGVAESHRGRGIGTAMVAAASEALRDRGVRQCHIGWTVATEFYGGLGYRVWRSYRMSRRDVSRI